MQSTHYHTELAMEAGPAYDIWDFFQRLIKHNIQDSKNRILNSYTRVPRRKPRKRPGLSGAILTPSTSIDSTPRPLLPTPGAYIQEPSLHESSPNTQRVDQLEDIDWTPLQHVSGISLDDLRRPTQTQIVEQDPNAWLFSPETSESGQNFSESFYSLMNQSVSTDGRISEVLGAGWCTACQRHPPCFCEAI